MNSAVDLHSHSSASDGTLSPAAVVRRAAAAGVRVLALTDHDTTDGIAEARLAAHDAGIALVAGAEISVSWGGRTVHVLGLNLNPDDPLLSAGLASLRHYRGWRAEEIGRRLTSAGIDGAYEGAKALSNGRLISRTHFARFLVGRGLAGDTQGVFKRFLLRGKPGHVRGEWATLEDALGWIRSAGGQAVIAHPARYGLTRTRVQRLFGEFRELGGAGVEVVSSSHGRDDIQRFARHAREQHLLASAGSDFHTPEYPWADLGRLVDLPAGCTPIWHDWPCAADGAGLRRAAAG